MASVNKSYQQQHSRIKKNIDSTITYNKDNAERFHDFQEITFKTALSAADRAALDAYERPVIEFNITNAPVSRLCGEFSKQEPSIYVSAKDGSQVDAELIAVLEGHFRHILSDAAKKNVQYFTYRDQLSGGFSVFNVRTKYIHEMSFEQEIVLDRALQPTYVGFDPMAKEVTKCDASYYFEVCPMSEAQFKDEHPDVNMEDIKFSRGTTDKFSWSYKVGNERVLMVAHYYEQKKKKKTIVQIAGGEVMEQSKYKKFVEEWIASGRIEQPPALIGEPRDTYETRICRYTIIETQVIAYEETSFNQPNFIFVDGDSVVIKDGDKSTMQQFTKPYIYHAFGLQRLTNLSGQAIANDFESMVMHKFMVAEESLPTQPDYINAYTDVQKAQTLVYKAFMDNDPNKAIPPPREVARVGLPQEVIATFNNCMQMLQNILGSYDASLGINDNQLSGVAIVEGATQSNAAAMPYIVNYMLALTQAANVMLHLFPKYYVTPRTIPIVLKNGEHAYQEINSPYGGLKFDYDPNLLQVNVEAGVSFAIAKNQALQQVTALMNSSELFAEFINTQGLDVLLDNMEFKGVDVVKDRAKQFMEQKQQQAAQQAQQPNPAMMEMQIKQQNAQTAQFKAQSEAQKNQTQALQNEAEMQLKAEEIKVQQMKANNEKFSTMAKIGETRQTLNAAMIRAAAEEDKTQSEMAISLSEHQLRRDDQEHRHTKDLLQIGNKMEETRHRARAARGTSKKKK